MFRYQVNNRNFTYCQHLVPILNKIFTNIETGELRGIVSVDSFFQMKFGEIDMKLVQYVTFEFDFEMDVEN